MPNVTAFAPGVPAVGWVVPDGDEFALIAGAVLVPFSDWEGTLSIASEPGLPRRKWCTDDQWRELFTVMFGEWGFKRLSCWTSPDNRAAQLLCRALGFEREGRLRAAYDGERDALVFGMTPDTCRWIR